MENPQIINLSIMIDDYVQFKTDLALAKRVFDVRSQEYNGISDKISRYELIAIYEGVSRDLNKAIQTAYDKYKEAESVYTGLSERASGFEKSKKDVIADNMEGRSSEDVRTLTEMIDDYTSFKVALVDAQANLGLREDQQERLSETLSYYDGIALYEGVIRDYYADLQYLLTEKRTTKEKIAELEPQAESFEKTRQETLAEIFSGTPKQTQ